MYSRGLSNNANDAEKEREYKSFVAETDTAFEHQDLNKFIYLDRIGNNASHRAYLKAISGVGGTQTAPIILEAKNEPFEARNGEKFFWIFASFSIGAGVFLLMVVIPKLNMAKASVMLGGGVKADLSFITFTRNAFMPQSKLFVTNVIAGLNLLIFLMMVIAGLGFISFDSPDLLEWGANYRPLILQGEWWRLLTSCFLHGGLMHIVGNLYGLYFGALFLETKLGKLRYVAVYLICGIAASAASIWWHPATVSVGASGAIFGLFGVSSALLTTPKFSFKENKFFVINNAIFIGLNLLLGLTGNIDNAAHIGGLVMGIILGYILYFFLPAPKPKRKYVRKSKVAEADHGTFIPITIKPGESDKERISF